MEEFRVLSNESFFESVSSIRIEKQGDMISVRELFDETYGGLEELFKYNQDVRTKSISVSCGTHKGTESSPAEIESQRRSIISRWKNDFYKKELSVGLDSILRINESIFTQTETGVISPRTNLDMERERRPSIIQISDANGNSLYIRSQIHYRNLGMFAEFRDFGVSYTNDPRTLLNLMNKRLIDTDWNNRLFDKKNKEVTTATQLKFKRPFVYMPEPHLVNILEEMYADGIPRITPTVKIIEINDNHQYIIRPSLKKVTDIALDSRIMQQLGEYYGVLHSLGLCDHNDRQMAHYALQKLPYSKARTRIVNFDPDYMLLDRRPLKSSRSMSDMDTRNFLTELSSEENYISKADYRIFRQARNAMIEYMVDLIGSKHIDSEILRRLKPNLKDYSVTRNEKINIGYNSK
jgi:hypothetical protein